MAYAWINGMRLYYEERGSGLPLVVLHGGAGAIGSDTGWGALTPLFAQSYRVIALEHRGHGRTVNPGGSLAYDVLADDLATFLTDLGAGPAHLAGMSDGGITALHLGLTRPELARSLVCVGVNYYVDQHVSETLHGVTPEVIERVHPLWHADLVAAHDIHQGPGYWRQLIQQVVGNARVKPAYSLHDLRQLSLPTLLIAGEQDPFGNLEQMVTMRHAVPHSELLIVNNAGHTVHDTHPHIVGPVMLDFLARHTSARDER